MTEQTTRQIGKLTLTIHGDRQLTLTRSFDAPRRLVWEAMTKAEHVKHWWGYGGVVVDQFDPRPGGKWRFVGSSPDGTEHGFRGEFREVVPIERIVQTFEWEGMPGHISVEELTLEERDGRTYVTGVSTFDTREDRDGMVATGMEQGAAVTYDQLEEYLRKMAA